MVNKILVNVWDKYWRWSVVEEVCNTKPRYFKCICDCWNINNVRLAHMRNWESKSCWCYNKESISKRSKKHGMIKTSEYKIWCWMIERCMNKNSQAYVNYWGRWITVAKEWMESFTEFYSYVWEKPSKKHTLDRIDNNWNYEPWNVKRSTYKEQARNRRNSVFYKWKCIPEWSEIIWISIWWLYARIKAHWIEKALSMKFELEKN